jgi:hypothetical protein
MGPIQKAVREGGDFWKIYVDGFESDVSAESPNFSPRARAHYRNLSTMNAAMQDKTRMDLCNEYGRLFQEGF